MANRAQRRRKPKNRLFTKKGMTRVIYIDENQQPRTVLTPVGSKIHKQAIKNAEEFKKKRKAERVKDDDQGNV